jgi:hypothetical protein
VLTTPEVRGRLFLTLGFAALSAFVFLFLYFRPASDSRNTFVLSVEADRTISGKVITLTRYSGEIWHIEFLLDSVSTELMNRERVHFLVNNENAKALFVYHLRRISLDINFKTSLVCDDEDKSNFGEICIIPKSIVPQPSKTVPLRQTFRLAFYFFAHFSHRHPMGLMYSSKYSFS